MKEIYELDATSQAELVKRGEISPLELVDAAIARVEEINPKINAVIHKHFDRARAQAKADLPDGPFKGVPFLLKDLGGGNLEGDPIHWGTQIWKLALYTSSHLIKPIGYRNLVKLLAGKSVRRIWIVTIGQLQKSVAPSLLPSISVQLIWFIVLIAKWQIGGKVDMIC